MSRLPLGPELERGPRVSILLDGEPVEATRARPWLPCCSRAARSRPARPPGGEPRGIFCGMGVCFDCLMVIDGVPNTRACMTWVREGLGGAPGQERSWNDGALEELDRPARARAADLRLLPALRRQRAGGRRRPVHRRRGRRLRPGVPEHRRRRRRSPGGSPSGLEQRSPRRATTSRTSRSPSTGPTARPA